MGWILFLIGLVLAGWHLKIDSGVLFKWINAIGTVVWQLFFGLLGLVFGNMGTEKDKGDILPALYLASIIGLVVSAGIALLRRANYQRQVRLQAAHLNRVYSQADEMYEG